MVLVPYIDFNKFRTDILYTCTHDTHTFKILHYPKDKSSPTANAYTNILHYVLYPIIFFFHDLHTKTRNCEQCLLGGEKRGKNDFMSSRNESDGNIELIIHIRLYNTSYIHSVI